MPAHDICIDVSHKVGEPNPSGICNCGCGMVTNKSRKSTVTRGQKINKGAHYQYIMNHDKRGLLPDILPNASEVVVAWAAGIYEGEGSVSGSTRTLGSIHIKIGQKDPWLLERLREHFGGIVGPLKRRAYGSVSYWELSGRRCRGFVRCIWPYLSPRRQEQIVRAARGGWSPETRSE